MDFEIIGQITDIEAIAVGNAIHEIARLRKFNGAGRWRKMKGFATPRFADDSISDVEIH